MSNIAKFILFLQGIEELIILFRQWRNTKRIR